MGYATKNIAYQVAEKEPQRNLSIVNVGKIIDEPMPDFNFLRTIFENSHGIKAWVSLNKT